MEALQSLASLEQENLACAACGLRRGCKQVVVADGNPKADLVIVGEGPGADEDRLGKPFVGRAGQLLDRILAAVQLDRKDCYITNVVKCRPPANRAPTPEESQVCTGLWLDKQLALLRPRIILTMGNTPTRHLLRTEQGITRLRGKWKPYAMPEHAETAALMPLFHPAYLLRNDTRAKGGPKSLTWGDIQEVAGVLRGQRPWPLPQPSAAQEPQPDNPQSQPDELPIDDSGQPKLF